MIAPRPISSLLEEIPFFAGLDKEMLTLIGGCGKNVRLAQGDYLYKEGDPARTFYVLREGQVALESFTPGRGIVTLQTVRPGNVLGVSWLVAPYRSQFDARVVHAGRGIEFDAECLRRKCDADPKAGYALMQRFMPVLIERMNTARLKAMDLYAPAALGDEVQ